MTIFLKKIHYCSMVDYFVSAITFSKSLTDKVNNKITPK